MEYINLGEKKIILLDESNFYNNVAKVKRVFRCLTWNMFCLVNVNFVTYTLVKMIPSCFTHTHIEN